MCSGLNGCTMQFRKKPGENRQGASRRHEAIRHDLLRISVNTKNSPHSPTICCRGAPWRRCRFAIASGERVILASSLGDISSYPAIDPPMEAISSSGRVSVDNGSGQDECDGGAPAPTSSERPAANLWRSCIQNRCRSIRVSFTVMSPLREHDRIRALADRRGIFVRISERDN